MPKCLLLILILSFTGIGHAAQDNMVYYWVDENGNVHYSDMPSAVNAKLILVKPGLTATADQAKFPEPTFSESSPSEQSIAEIAVEHKLGGDNSGNSNDVNALQVPDSAEDCRDLRVEMNKRMRELNGVGNEQARLARIFLTEADKALKQGNCQ
ncbi:DUF4124 domain-containing protein [Colwellia sp. MEBiC06753]